jgi:hypothetical protein
MDNVKALEAAARALQARVRAGQKKPAVWSLLARDIYTPAAEAAITAYLSALAEDEATVERVAEVFLSEARALHEMTTMTAGNVSERMMAQIAIDNLQFQKTKEQAKRYARAALAAIKGE